MSRRTLALGVGWMVAGTGDFNADGRADILLQNGQQLALWEMNGPSILGGSGGIGTTLPTGWVVAGVADFTSDGRSEHSIESLEALRNDAPMRQAGSAITIDPR